MDKYEYNLKLDQMKSLFADEKYEEAAELADSINWNKVKNPTALLRAGEIYEKTGRYSDSRDVLLLAYDRSPIGRSIIFRLAEVAIKMEDYQAAQDYYEEFVVVAPHDNMKYVLHYDIKKAQGAPYEELIPILEELREQEYSEEWAYELAYLYHKAGMSEKCIDACDELILWFGDGPYVERALELKMLYQPLTKAQEEKYRSFRQTKAGYTHINIEDLQRAGEYANEPVAIPQVKVNQERFNTVNLQEEIARGMQQIIDATEKSTVTDTLDNINRIVEEIPYLMLAKEKLPSEDEMHIETDEEIDGSLKINFQELLGEDSDGQFRMMMNERMQLEHQITGQITIEEVLEEWERTRRAAEAALQEAEYRKLESAKARALQQAGGIMERLTDVIPKLDAGVTPRELLEEEYLQQLPGMYEEDTEEYAEPEAEEYADGEPEPIEGADSYGEQDSTAEELYAESGLADAEAGYGKAGIEVITAEELQQGLEEEPVGRALFVEEPVPEAGIPEESFQEEPMAAEPFMDASSAEGPYMGEPAMAQSFIEEPYMRETMMAGSLSEDAYMGQAAMPEAFADRAYMGQTVMPEAFADRAYMGDPAMEEAGSEGAYAGNPAMEEPDAEGAYMGGPAMEEAAAENTHMGEFVADEYAAGEPYVERPVPEESLPEELSAGSAAERVADEEPDDGANPAKEVLSGKAPLQERMIAEGSADKFRFGAGKKTAAEKPKTISERWKGKTLRIPDVKEPEDLGGEEASDEPEIIEELTEEQKKIFSYFIPVKGMEKQLCRALTGVSRRIRTDQAASGGNLIIQGGQGCGKTTLATSIIKVLQEETGHPNEKIGKIKADALNSKDIAQLLRKVAGGCLIIEQAGEMSRESIVTLSLLLEQDTSGILIILEDTSKGIKKTLSQDDGFAKKFTEKISVPNFSNDELVAFARSYSKELGYEIDEMAVLALYNRISNIQRLDQETTLTEVKDIVDEAIEREAHGGMKKYFSILTASRYTDDDLIVLREKDFE